MFDLLGLWLLFVITAGTTIGMVLLVVMLFVMVTEMLRDNDHED